MRFVMLIEKNEQGSTEKVCVTLLVPKMYEYWSGVLNC